MMSRTRAEGFGFLPAESAHHFLVTIPSDANASILISEHLIRDESTAHRALSFAMGHDDATVRVVLPRLKWDAMADAVRAEFNRRLRQSGLKAGIWKPGQTSLSRLLGKELVLLAWAIEDADTGLIPVAIKNWLGLAPEERWWLFTMTNAATGHALIGRNKGWRKAVRYALTENPVSDHPPQRGQTELFDDAPLVAEKPRHRNAPGRNRIRQLHCA